MKKDTITCLKNTAIAIVLIVAGVFSIASADNFLGWYGDYADLHSYGGDAYTGIQNAAAIGANNVARVIRLLSNGFVHLFRIIGIVLLGTGVSSLLANIIPLIAKLIKAIAALTSTRSSANNDADDTDKQTETFFND